MLKFLGERAREGAVLADRQQARREIIAAEPRAHSCTIELAEVRDRQIRSRVHAMACDHGGLATVHRGDRRTHRRSERRLANKRELRVEHDSGCAAGDARSRGVLADPAVRPHRHVELDQPLQQHERGLVADPTTGFGALRDQAACARGDRDLRFFERRYLREHAARSGPARDGGGLADHDRHARGELVRLDTVRDPGGQLSAAGHRECARGGGPIASEIENTECAGGGQRRHQSDIWPLER